MSEAKPRFRLDVGVAPWALRLAMHLLLFSLIVLGLCVVVFRWDQIGTLSDTRWQIILTVIGLTVGVWFAGILARGSGRFRRTSTIGIVALIASQACYLLLVWTTLKMQPLTWRIWWLALVVATAATHIVWLRLTAAPDRRRLSRAAVACGLIAAAVLATLALRSNVLAGPFPGFFWSLIPPAAFAIIASAILWLRGVKLFRNGVPRPVRIGWHIAFALILLSLGFYSGRLTAPGPALIDGGLSPLAQMSVSDLLEQTAADLQRLKMMSAGLVELEAKVGRLPKGAERPRLTPDEQDRLRSLFMSYLAYRDGILRMAAFYAGYDSVRDPATRARCILLGQAAGSMLFEYSLKLVNWYRDDQPIRDLLNEPEPRWGIPGGVYDRIYDNVINPANLEALAELGAYVEANEQQWREAQVFQSNDMDWLTGHIARSTSASRGLQLNPIGARWDRAMARIGQQTYTPFYATQSFVSTWIGDTRLVQWQPMITHQQIRDMRSKLRPGDILLERRNWFLSNAFLPGFWPHSAVYIGTPDDLVELGLLSKTDGRYLATDDRLRKWLSDYLKPAHDGELHTVIESVSDGVIFNSLEESMHADYVAVLRPRLTDQQKAEAIARCFEHIGKPYDFDFDISTTEKMVCSEIVYYAYADTLRLEDCVQKVMGREALPPLEIARKFALERDKPNQELDFVLFLDGIMSQRAAILADEEAFANSIYRPKGFSE